MMFRSTCRPGAAGPKIDGVFEETTRRPLIKVSVRAVPKPNRLTKFTATPNDD